MAKKVTQTSAKKSGAGFSMHVDGIKKTLEEFGCAVDGAMDKIRPENGTLKWAALIVFGIVLALLFRFTLDTEVSAMGKFVACAAMLAIGGELMRRFMKWDGSWGLIFFRDVSTLAWIDRQAKRYSDVWRMVADLGIVFGYGASAYFVLGKEGRADKVRFALLLALGIPCVIVFSSVLAPMAIGFLISMVKGVDLGTATAQVASSVPGQEALYVAKVGALTMRVTPVSLGITLMLVLFGLGGMTTLSIIGYGAFVLTRIGAALLGGAALSKTAPGGAPIIPGINLPLVEGIVALGAILVVHELMHAFLARMANVKLHSAGVVFFGILPFGAFVDPDEKEMAKLPDTPHNRLLGAGSAANLISAVLAMFLFLALFYATADWRADGFVVLSGPLPAGSGVNSINWNADHTIATINTTSGVFERHANAEGKIGIMMGVASRWSPYAMSYLPQFGWMGFIMACIGLTFSLNILVGMVNLLPVPMFDGHHIAKRVLGDGLALKALTWATAGAFVLNFIPWLFR